MKTLKIIGVDEVVLIKFMLPIEINCVTRAELTFKVPLNYPISRIVVEDEGKEINGLKFEDLKKCTKVNRI